MIQAATPQVDGGRYYRARWCHAHTVKMQKRRRLPPLPVISHAFILFDATELFPLTIDAFLHFPRKIPPIFEIYHEHR